MQEEYDDTALVEEITRHVLDSADHPALRWNADRSEFLLRIGQVIPKSYLPTTKERRRRLRSLLRERLLGWREFRPGFWERVR